MKKLFCSRPFEWFEIHTAYGDTRLGDVYLCCPAWLSKKIGNLAQSSIDEIWNSNEAKEIRASILDGSFKYCKKDLCPYLKSASRDNILSINNSEYSDDLQSLFFPLGSVKNQRKENLKKAIDQKVTNLPYGPLTINASYDKSCNLACPTCRKDFYVIEKDSCQKEAINNIHEKLLERAQTFEVLYFSGNGDPFVSPVYRRLLKDLSKIENLKSKIHIHTNGLLWTKSLWEEINLSEKIKSAEISIDAATKKTYAENRCGGDFSKLLENLKFIKSLREKNILEFLQFSFVVQENNFKEMVKFIKLGKKFSADRIYFSKLSDWSTFRLDEYKIRSVHLTENKNNKKFLKIINKSIFKKEKVFLGNL